MSHGMRESLFRTRAAIGLTAACIGFVAVPQTGFLSRALAQEPDRVGLMGSSDDRLGPDLRSSTGPGNPVTEPMTAPPSLGAGIYKLGRGDRLRVRVYDREDFSWDVMVREDGNVQIPYLGKFDVTGRTTGEIEEQLAAALRRRLNRDTSVAVDVIERRPFFIVGVVSKPGSYQFQPGMIVLHAVALAGGVVRNETGSFLAADASRETAKLQTSSEELKRLVAARTRLAAERKGQKEISAAPELVELTGETEANRLITAENEILKSGLEVTERDRKGLTAAIELSDKEIASLEKQLGEIKLQRNLRDKQLSEVQGLISRGLTTTQRVTDSQLAISLLDRDNLEANANIARAKQNRQKSLRDLDMLSLDRKSKIEQEIARLDEQVEKAKVAIRSSRKIIQQITGLPASMQTPTGNEPVLAYQIMRKNPDGNSETIAADEQSPLEPGDILKVTPRVNQISTGSNR